MQGQADWWWAETGALERYQQDAIGILAERGVRVSPETPRDTINEVLRIVSLLWVDGSIRPVERFYLDPGDEGLLFGRGVWESTRTSNGVPWLWPWHLDRLRKTAQLLGIPLNPERLPSQEQVTSYVRQLTTSDVVIRLNVTAGRPGQEGLVWMTAALQPVAPTAIRLKTVVNPVQNHQPYLLWKTFQYATRLRVGQEAALAGFDSALLIDAQGLVLEAAHANVFARFANGWQTPAANGGLLPGTVRQFLLRQSPLKITEAPIHVSTLSQAQELFVTNSNHGIVPVTQIDDRSYPIGSETTHLMQWLLPKSAAGIQLHFSETQTPLR